MSYASVLYSLNVFEEWGEKAKIWWENLDPVNVWGSILVTIGIAAFILLIIFTEYKREERDSMKFTMIILVIFALCAGFGFHMILVSNGF